MKTFFATLTLIVAPQLRAATPHCEVRHLGDNHVEIRKGDHRVQIIGWEHPGSEDYAQIREATLKAIELGKDRNCAAAETHLRLTVDKQKNQIERARNVLVQLESLHSESQIQSLGVELTPDEWAYSQDIIKSIDLRVSELISLCPSLSKHLINSLKLVTPGPEYQYSQMKVPKIEILALEDQAAKDRNSIDLERLQSTPFDFSIYPWEPNNISSLMKIKELTSSLQTVPDELFESTVSFEKDPTKRASIKAALKAHVINWTELLRGAYGRNVSIAKMAWDEPGAGTSAVVIGWNHVTDLAEKLKQICESESSPRRDGESR